ncbi:MAG: enoyl-CoA hydratase/isomerase family protein [Bradyrhizobium sp.]|nr:enoyl-CoA hydratase/isomerase family protein [Bradyrhizobium sp.]
MQDDDAPIRTSLRDGVGTIELARPAVFNCLSRQMLSDIDHAMATFERDGARTVLVTASGRNFCTGAALDEVEQVRQGEAELCSFLALGHAVLDRIEAGPLPVVAAVQGLCLAGGIELALACDVVFAAEDARFGDQHAALGLIPGWGGSQRLTRTIGLRRALDLMYSARWIDAPAALQWGLVNHVVPAARLHDEALSYARQLATRSRAGLSAIKRLGRHAANAGQSLPDGLRLEQREAMHVLTGTDINEGLAAFRERRVPNFAR